MRTRVLGTVSLALVALALVACGGGEKSTGGPPGVTVTVSPAASPSPVPSPAATPTPQPTPSGPRLLYSRFGTTEDVIVVSPGAAPEQGETLATVSHVGFWGINASVSPDGKWVAYTRLSPDVRSPEITADSEAEVWLLPLPAGQPVLVGRGADVRVAPVWSPDSSRLVYQGFDRERNTFVLSLVSVREKTAKPLVSVGGATPVSLLSFDRRGREVYVVQMESGVSSVLAVDASNGSLRTVGRAPGSVARDWQPSPDRRQASFVAQSAGGGWGVWVMDLESGSVRQVQGLPRDRELFSPVWHPEGGALAVGVAPAGAPGGVLIVPLSGGEVRRMPPPSQGFDVPVAWSPQGEYLVVQEFAEYPVRQRGILRVLTADGKRFTPAGEAEVSFIGWLPGED